MTDKDKEMMSRMDLSYDPNGKVNVIDVSEDNLIMIFDKNIEEKDYCEEDMFERILREKFVSKEQ